MKLIKKISLLSVLAIFGLSFFVSGVQAQETDELPERESKIVDVIPERTYPEGQVNCFDYYEFGSVQVEFGSMINSTVSGVPMTFQGKIKNNNSYPVVDGQLYIKVFREQTDEDKAHANGFYLVDQFFAKEDIYLNANESQDINFNWEVPNYAVSGDYQIATFFTSAKKYNLLGLSFTDDVVGNTFSFKVSAENEANVEFDKNTVDINGKNHHFAAFIPKFEKEENVIVKANLVNSTKEDQSIPVTWTLYSWDGLQEKNIIDTKNETIDVKANQTNQLSYTITNQDYPVYYLVAEAKYNDSKSILNIRMGRNGVDRTRVNFPAVTSYPLKAGEQNTLFACAHNAGTANTVSGNKLVVTLLDDDMKEIHKYTYEGNITGDMMGLKEDFTPAKDYNNFYIKSQLYTDGKLVDEAIMKYDCSKLDAENCIKALPPLIETESSDKNSLKSIISTIIGILLLISLGIIAYAIIKKKKGSSVIGMFLLILIAGSIMLIGSVEKVEAKSVTWSKFVGKDFASPFWIAALKNPTFGIGYGVSITNATNTATELEVLDGATIPVGTKLKLNFKSYKNTDISWHGTGYTRDTPYGYWNTNAEKPAGDACSRDSFVNTYTYSCTGITRNYSGTQDVHIQLSVNPPTKAIAAPGLSCEDPASDGSVLCTVNSVGTKTVDFNFGSTYGKMYYAWRSDRSGCYVRSGIPMRESTNCDPLPNDGSACPTTCTVSSSEYRLQVPAQKITYNLTAQAPEGVPTVPIVTGLTEGVIDTDYTFNFTSTDPDGDGIRYGIDWDNDGGVDVLYPQWNETAIVSGVTHWAVKSWTGIGDKTFRVKAYDTNWNESDWSLPHTITIATVPVPGKCSDAATEAVEWDDSWTYSGSSQLCEEGNAEPSSLAPPIPGRLTRWTCESTTGGTDRSCSVCKKLNCDSILDKSCEGQKIPDGCGGYCNDGGNEGKLHCRSGVAGYDAKCCGGNWAEVKPD